MRPTLHLIDGSGYIYRAFFAIRPLSTRAGVPTNAVIGFAKMLGKLLKDEKPQLLGIAFESKERTHRHAIYTEYKANREQAPETLAPQFPLIQELVAALDIPRLQISGYEADDVLATLTKKAVAAGYDVVLVTGDKDLMQLVGPHVAMFDPMKDKKYGRDDVIEKFGVPPELVADVLALAGDTSDNVPGVPKVGLKSAAKLVSEHGDIEAIMRAVGGMPAPKAVERSVVDNAELARLSKRLVVLVEDAPVELDTQALAYAAPDADKLGGFLKKIEAFTLLREFGLGPEAGVAAQPAAPARPASPATEAAVQAGLPFMAPAAAPAPAPQLALPPIDRAAYRTVTELTDLEALAASAKKTRVLALELVTTGEDPMRSAIVGIGLCTPEHAAVYVPIAHRYLGAPRQLALADVLERLRPLLSDPAVKKLGRDLKHATFVLARAGATLDGIGDDLMLAAYVLDPGRASFTLDALAREGLGHQTIREADIRGTGKSTLPFEMVPVQQATSYAAENADLGWRLSTQLSREVDAAGLRSLYREIELPLSPVLGRMERAGVLVDQQHLRMLAKEFDGRLIAVEKKAQGLAGVPVNLQSTKQLGVLLFEKLGIPPVKKTKTGYSTDHEVLEQLARSYELPAVILEHRQISKLKSTYVDALLKLAHPETGRVHTTFNQTGAATGRLSSTDPNLQNIPARSEDGRRIRAAFIAAPGWTLISADYSQIELRIMAHLSGDEAFLQAFRSGDDIHTRTAREVLTGGAEPDTEARRRAKAINFGIIYGLSEFGLSKQLGIPRKESADYIARYFARYPGIRAYLDRAIEDGRDKGYVQTLCGRRRYLPDLKSKNGAVRQGAERIAMNTPLQGTAADLIKLAMIRVDTLLRARDLQARLLLQVHDELVLEAPLGERDTVIALVQKEMAQVMTLAVPLSVDVGHGATWADAH